MAKWHRWTEEEREVVRRDYAHTHASRRELGGRLGVTEFAIAGQVARLGLGKRSDRRQWTEEEEVQLGDMIGRLPPLQIARRMKRSVNSVVVKSKRLGLRRRTRNGWYTKKEVCEILGMDHKWVQRRIDNGSLKAASFHPGPTPQQNGSACWRIGEDDLRVYLRTYPEDLNGRNVDLMQVVEILVGVL